MNIDRCNEQLSTRGHVKIVTNDLHRKLVKSNIKKSSGDAGTRFVRFKLVILHWIHLSNFCSFSIVPPNLNRMWCELRSRQKFMHLTQDINLCFSLVIARKMFWWTCDMTLLYFRSNSVQIWLSNHCSQNISNQMNFSRYFSRSTFAKKKIFWPKMAFENF